MYFDISFNEFSFQMKEKTALCLGYLCVGEHFPLTSKIVEQLIASAKEARIIQCNLIDNVFQFCSYNS